MQRKTKTTREKSSSCKERPRKELGKKDCNLVQRKATVGAKEGNSWCKGRQQFVEIPQSELDDRVREIAHLETGKSSWMHSQLVHAACMHCMC